MINPFRDI